MNICRASTPAFSQLLFPFILYDLQVPVSLLVPHDGETETQKSEYVLVHPQADDGRVSADRVWVLGPSTVGLEDGTPKARPASSFLSSSERAPPSGTVTGKVLDSVWLSCTVQVSNACLRGGL